MDYEKKYNEALERVRRLHDRMQVLSSTDALVASAELEFIFPELAESEDERIRKELIEAFEAYDIESTWNGIPIRSIFAWLEKQKEQKPATDSKSERVIKAARSVLNNWLDGTDCPDVSGDFAELEYAIREYDGEEKQKEQKPEWSEEDENVYESIQTILLAEARFVEERKWFDSIKARIRSVCWSEEDEKKITFLERLIRYNVPEGQYGWADGHKSGFITKSEAISKLKSLRPSWKPSEEQMAALEAATVRYQSTGLESLYEELKKVM